MKERFIELRKSLGLTMEEFGKRLGVTRSAISNIESGRRGITEQMVVAACREFNASEDWIRNGEGDMFLEEPGNDIEALAKHYELNELETILLRKFLSLSDAQRKAVNTFILDVFSEFSETHEERKETHECVTDPSEATEEEKLAAYQEFLETKKKAEAK